MTTTIRPIEASDEMAWRALFSAYGEFYKTSFDENTLSGVFSWLMDGDHPEQCFVAESQGTVVGFAHLQRQVDTFTAGPGWFLDDLFVDPDHRGAGIARALISHLSSYAAAHGGGTLRWITAADNHTAQGLYDQIATRTSWVMYESETGSGS
jgi:GNAT superfamily N-acetyltransferase